MGVESEKEGVDIYMTMMEGKLGHQRRKSKSNTPRLFHTNSHGHDERDVRRDTISPLQTHGNRPSSRYRCTSNATHTPILLLLLLTLLSLISSVAAQPPWLTSPPPWATGRPSGSILPATTTTTQISDNSTSPHPSAAPELTHTPAPSTTGPPSSSSKSADTAGAGATIAAAVLGSILIVIILVACILLHHHRRHRQEKLRALHEYAARHGLSPQEAVVLGYGFYRKAELEASFYPSGRGARGGGGGDSIIAELGASNSAVEIDEHTGRFLQMQLQRLSQYQREAAVAAAAAGGAVELGSFNVAEFEKERRDVQMADVLRNWNP
ncbi:hypothetical protein DFH27DRAFT_603000 [Peziza echinospora]|nr:hypothetical protein DFH27DRAFT_603000 [Peziza echinospora]